MKNRHWLCSAFRLSVVALLAASLFTGCGQPTPSPSPTEAPVVTVVTVSIDAPGKVDADSGFTITVDISQVTDFDATNYNITFDDSVLRLDNVTAGVIDGTAIPVDVWNEISPGTYTIVQNVPGREGVSGSGYLAVLHFHVKGSSGTSSAITLQNGVLGDKDANQIIAQWIGDLVNVS